MNWQKLKKTWRKKRCAWLRELSEYAIVWLIAGSILSPIVGQSPIYWCIMVFFPSFFRLDDLRSLLERMELPEKGGFPIIHRFCLGV